MNGTRILFILMMGMSTVVYADTASKRLFVVSSYHKEYLWSQSTQRGT